MTMYKRTIEHGRQWAGRYRWRLFALQAAVLLVMGLILGYMLAAGGGTSPDDDHPSTAAKTPADDSAASNADSGEPTIWTCSMHPQIRQPGPGKCPICSMDLIPVTATSGGLRTLTVSPEAKALMSVETAPVERRYVTHQIPMVGKVDYDETRLGYITAWVSGRLDRLYVDYTGVQVRKGDHMVYIYSEELYAAQEELIQALRYANQRPNGATLGGSGLDLVASAREKLRLLGLTAEQIAQIERRTKPSDHMTIYAPESGIVIEKLKQEGERVHLGDRIYTIADLSQVWVHLDAYESDLPWIRYGQDVTITTEAYPGEKFHGRIAFIQPVLNDKTRTVKVRVNVPNEDGRLKPEMFVHAMVQPKVAAGGRVMDSSLAGKWICPMHPEVIKDESADCDTCGMPLVRAESLGYVTPQTDTAKPPLVIPYSAVLPTGRRAVVYVELPVMHSAAGPAFQTLRAVVEEGDLAKIRRAFATYAAMLDLPYDQPGTEYAQRVWDQYADRLARDALAGQRAATPEEAQQALARIEATMNSLGEHFAAPGQPTFEGREIVLGPRAGDYVLVRHGLEDGQLVVTQGNFKIDAEVQIQAKPSMMTPEGGAAGGEAEKPILAAEFYDQIRTLEETYQQLTEAIEAADGAQAHAAFDAFGQALAAVDVELLTGQPRILWREFAMLLGNDAVEGRDATTREEADRVYLLVKAHMRRMRQRLGIKLGQAREVQRIAAGPEFQQQLARLWQAYLPIQQALAADDFQAAQTAVTTLASAAAAVDAGSLEGHAVHVWAKEQKNLTKALAKAQSAADIAQLRDAFAPLSDEIGVLAKAFGFGDAVPVYEVHCPMALQGRGANWYQDNDDVRNPYYGATMLKCANRVERIDK